MTLEVLHGKVKQVNASYIASAITVEKKTM